MRKIPRCMSTQHPDNVSIPFFAKNPELDGEDEVMEAFYVFSHLGADEQMWDYEGKEGDDYVVKKLLSKYKYFFKENRLGKDIFLTLRIPNPEFEVVEAKILLETLESIPRSFDTAYTVFKDEISPIFEVILPMTTSAKSLERVYRYYTDFVVGKEEKPIFDSDIKVKDWVNEFKPKKIYVIPLFEDFEHIVNADSIVEEYVKEKDFEYLRVFLARSDPAMNYGLISAVLIVKLALYKLWKLSNRIGLPIYPIVGVGSAPFRGNLKPNNVLKIANEYRSVHTYTVQSSFKYDYPVNEVVEGLKQLKGILPTNPKEIDEKFVLDFFKRGSLTYFLHVENLEPVINKVAKHIPSRRKRKLHVGLFGYSRDNAKLKLPRAIAFTGSLYSIGVPPEILDLIAIEKDDYFKIKSLYENFESDLKDALKFANVDSPFFPKEVLRKLEEFGISFEVNEEHKELTKAIYSTVLDLKNYNLDELILRASLIRKFIG
ncbi:phosphoenolpyruvate carboxylase [Caldisericum exile AZM16c01]|uniref:Phosphoenolpyruvate carboxylase n=2 Tax=Caldisericum exile TaxID=693075 RepID=A0A7U6GFR5_CALEA|nr:phosphoenolpyruvate carboxylase [Caldisericum exile AZM16c01]